MYVQRVNYIVCKILTLRLLEPGHLEKKKRTLLKDSNLFFKKKTSDTEEYEQNTRTIQRT